MPRQSNTPKPSFKAKTNTEGTEGKEKSVFVRTVDAIIDNNVDNNIVSTLIKKYYFEVYKISLHGLTSEEIINVYKTK